MRMPKDLSKLSHQNFGERTFLFFVDETGDESLSDPNQPFFGFGGCGVLGIDLDRLITRPWQEVRRLVGGSHDSPLHAAKLSRPRSLEHVEAISSFFESNLFTRFGVSCDAHLKAPTGITTAQILLLSLQNRLNYLLQRVWVTDVIVIFEHSERLERAITRGFGDFVPHQFDRVLDLTLCFMPKAANEPSLEVADFVANAIGQEARRHHRNDSGEFQRKNFQAVFHNKRNTIISFAHTRSVSL
jgi:hypothetical protein